MIELKKGDMFVDVNDWVGIVMEKTRTNAKNYNNYTIINMVEMYGFEQECGSKYLQEVVRVIGLEEFNAVKQKLGHAGSKSYYKGVINDIIRT